MSLQLAAFGEGFHAGGAVEDSGLLGAGRRAWLVQLLVFLQADPDCSCLFWGSSIYPYPWWGQTQTMCWWCVCVCVSLPPISCAALIWSLLKTTSYIHGVFFKWLRRVIKYWYLMVPNRNLLFFPPLTRHFRFFFPSTIQATHTFFCDRIKARPLQNLKSTAELGWNYETLQTRLWR